LQPSEPCLSRLGKEKLRKILGSAEKTGRNFFHQKKFVFDFAAKKLKIDYFTLLRSSEPVFNFFQGPDSLQKKKIIRSSDSLNGHLKLSFLPN
jgi:hypothetical protein